MADYVVEFGKAGAPPEPDGRLDAPAFHRNHQPIWSALSPYLGGKSGDVLELGSGTGQHVVEFARRSPQLTWWPSDYNAKHLHSIAAWRAYAALPNVRAPVAIDLSQADSKLDALGLPTSFVAMFCANVIHIAPWRVSEALLQLAAEALSADGRLFIYGPFSRDGRHISPSNAEFDASLRCGNPEWGVRDIADLTALARSVKLDLEAMLAMPANNNILVFARAS